MATKISGHSIYINTNGLKHHLLSYAGGDSGNILILPGVTSPAVTADFIAQPLSGLGYTVYVPDLRGRGETEVAPAGSYRLIDYAADVNGIIGELGISQPAIIGHSLGARIAAAYVVLYSLNAHGPLVLVDPPTSGPDRGPYPTSRASFLAQLQEAREGTTVEAVRLFYPKWPERELQLRAEVLASCNEIAVVESHAGFEAEDFFDYWSKVTRPAFLLRGAESPVVPVKAVADLAARNPNIPIFSISAAGHMVPWDNFKDFFRILRPLLRTPEKTEGIIRN